MNQGREQQRYRLLNRHARIPPISRRNLGISHKIREGYKAAKLHTILHFNQIRIMNSFAIELNNHGVAELKYGNIVRAFELLSKAGTLTMTGLASHAHSDDTKSTFRFHWEDCSRANDATTHSKLSWEGSVSFVFVRALRITYSGTIDDVDSQCACGYAWTVWYNLALVSTIIGTHLGEKGKNLMAVAFELYQKVQRRVDSENSSKHWDLLQMAILNNQACIYRDFSMVEAMASCLEELSVVISSTDVEDYNKTSFFLTLDIMGSSIAAPSA